MTARNRLTSAVLLCFAWLVSSSPCAEQDEENGRAKKLQALLTERRDTLHERLEFVQAMHKIGRAELYQVIDARNAVLDAELELASTKEKRLALRQERIKSLRQLEEIASQRHENGTQSIEDRLLATAARLQAEVDWLREQVTDSKQEEQPDYQTLDSPNGSKQRPQVADTGGPSQAAKTYPVWAGEWELSQKLNEILGYHDDNLRTNEWPSSFRLSLSNAIGDGMDTDLLTALRGIFAKMEHQIVGTGKWEMTFTDASGASQDSGYETSCFVTEQGGATFLWVPVPFAILYGGKISFLEGADREHDAIVIDFNSMPKHLAGIVRASDTVAYKRRSE